MKYIQPQVDAESFTCPHCAVIANQRWDGRTPTFEYYRDSARDIIRIGHCDHCKKYTLWHRGEMVYPSIGHAPPANPDMPDPVLKIYREAASISGKSPRGAAGLLRLGIQLLCKELGEPGKDINGDIGSLVRKGLPDAVQKSLDIVRYRACKDFCVSG